MEIRVRDTCNTCNGTGIVMDKEQAMLEAKLHNARARQCNTPNFLNYEDFMNCTICKGTGLKEGWVSLPELRSMLA